MQHHILVRFASDATPRQALIGHIQTLFEESLSLEGVRAVRFHESVIDMPGRYDLMIVIEMDRDALARFDASPIHARWKREYGAFIHSKAVFDCE